MITILNSVCTIMFYMIRRIKQDLTCICFEKKINLICSIFVIYFKFRFHCCVLYDEMNKIRSHLHMF
jgi:hypothetical protein